MNNEQDQNPIDALLRRLADDDAAIAPAPRVEARLRREVQALAAEQRRGRSIVLALAAGLLLTILPLVWWVAGSPSRPITTIAQEITTPFFPLFYGSVPASGAHIVRMQVPRASLARFGLMSADAIDAAAGMVLADVLIGDDGLARAVRFVQSPAIQERRQ